MMDDGSAFHANEKLARNAEATTVTRERKPILPFHLLHRNGVDAAKNRNDNRNHNSNYDPHAEFHSDRDHYQCHTPPNDNDDGSLFGNDEVPLFSFDMDDLPTASAITTCELFQSDEPTTKHESPLKSSPSPFTSNKVVESNSIIGNNSDLFAPNDIHTHSQNIHQERLRTVDMEIDDEDDDDDDNNMDKIQQCIESLESCMDRSTQTRDLLFKDHLLRNMHTATTIEKPRLLPYKALRSNPDCVKHVFSADAGVPTETPTTTMNSECFLHQNSLFQEMRPRTFPISEFLRQSKNQN